jgi:hypothetical protein
MSVSYYEGDVKEIMTERYKKLSKLIPKFQYRIKEIMGDYYYEKMKKADAFDKIFIEPQS